MPKRTANSAQSTAPAAEPPLDNQDNPFVLSARKPGKKANASSTTPSIAVALLAVGSATRTGATPVPVDLQSAKTFSGIQWVYDDSEQKAFVDDLVLDDDFGEATLVGSDLEAGMLRIKFKNPEPADLQPAGELQLDESGVTQRPCCKVQLKPKAKLAPGQAKRDAHEQEKKSGHRKRKKVEGQNTTYPLLDKWMREKGDSGEAAGEWVETLDDTDWESREIKLGCKYCMKFSTLTDKNKDFLAKGGMQDDWETVDGVRTRTNKYCRITTTVCDMHAVTHCSNSLI